MRIINLEVVQVAVNHRGDWLFVRLVTDEGPVGLGEASHGGGGPDRDAIVTAILERQCLPRLRGQDPRAVAVALQALRPLAQGRAGATAVSACEQALWDIAGQAAGVPVYRLLGGPVRQRIPLYANVNRAVTERTPAGFARAAADAVAEGFRAVTCAPFDGVVRQRVRDRDQRARVQLGLDCVAAMREAVGPDVDVLVDCHSVFDGPLAVEVGRALRRLDVTWFEEPVPTEDLEALVRLRPLVPDLELIGGEALYGLSGFWPYLAAGVWDVVMPDVKHCGGLTDLLTIARVAEARGVGVAPHNPSGPVAMAASAHAAAALPQLRALEYAWGEVPWRPAVIMPREEIIAGELVLPDSPGLGIVLDEAAIAAHRAGGEVK
ncbi:MAG: mandelate racemase/muconate lactonizing enzyme family protein [Thermomicrobiales bacterium]